MKNLLASWFNNILAFDETGPVKKEFSIVDPTAAQADGLNTVVLSVDPSDGTAPTIVSLYFDGTGVKLFEKKYQNDADAQSDMSAMAKDLEEAATLSKEQKTDEAKNLATELFDKYKRSSDPLTNEQPTPTMTQSSLNSNLEYKGFQLTQEGDGNWNGILTDRIAIRADSAASVKAKIDKMFHKAAGKTLKKEAGIVMQNVFFDNVEEAMDFQKQTKELQGPEGSAEGKPLWEQNGNGEQVAPSNETKVEEDNELAPPSLSFDRIEKDKAKSDKDIGKRIKDQVKTEVESALEEKSASVFGPDQEDLVEALRKNGRNWDEIKKIFVKDLSYNEDDTAVFLDGMRANDEGGMPEGLPMPPKPPEDLVSPETHDKLVKEVTDKTEPMPMPKPLEDEIARADNAEIRKVASQVEPQILKEIEELSHSMYRMNDAPGSKFYRFSTWGNGPDQKIYRGEFTAEGTDFGPYKYILDIETGAIQENPNYKQTAFASLRKVAVLKEEWAVEYFPNTSDKMKVHKGFKSKAEADAWVKAENIHDRGTDVDVYKIASKKIAINPLQEPPAIGQNPGQPLSSPVQENPTFDAPVPESQTSAPEPEFLEAPHDGDRVYVMGDYETGDDGFEGTMGSEFKSKGDDFAVVYEDNGDSREVALHRVVKASQKKVAKAYYEKKATAKCEVCEDIRSEEDPGREYDPTCVGYLCSKHEEEWNKKKEKTASDTPASRCSAPSITWGGKGYQCLNCGAEGEHSWDIKHDPKKNPQLKASSDKTADYQGYSNYDTWGLSLWLDNEQDLYNLAHTLAQEIKDPNVLAKNLQGNFGSLLEEKGETDKNSANVNWTEVANNLLADVKEQEEHEHSQSPTTQIENFPTLNIEEEKDKIITQLQTETDPAKKQELERKYKHLTMASLNSIKEAALKIQADLEHEGEIALYFRKEGIEKQASGDSAFEANGWCRVWIQEDEIASDSRYPAILKLPDENARIVALKELARDLAHEALSLADSSASKVGVQSWFESLNPSDHDRIDWVSLASPKSEEDEDLEFEREQLRKYGPDAVHKDFKDQIIPKSSQDTKIEKKADGDLVALYNLDKMVTSFNETSQDWSGETQDFGFIDKGQLNVNSMEEALAKVKEIYGMDFEPVSDQPGRFETNQTENAEGYADPNGKYLADYSVYIKLYKEQSTGPLREASQKKQAVERFPEDHQHNWGRLVDPKNPDGDAYCVECNIKKSDFEKDASLKQAAEPLLGPTGEPLPAKPETPTTFKKNLKAPSGTEREKAQPATQDQAQLVKEVESSLSSLDAIKSMVEQAKAKLNAEIKAIEEAGGRVQIEGELKAKIDRLSKLVEATQNQMVYAGETMVRLVQETKDKPFKPNDAWKVQKLTEKFAGAQEYLDKAIAGAQSLATTEQVRDLVFFPRKTSKLSKKANFLETLDEVYNDIMAALKLIIGNEPKEPQAV